MATGFTRSKATLILSSTLSNSYVALSTTVPSETGSNFTEPASSTGYQRQSIGELDTSKSGQVANKNIIFLYECTADGGSATHLGLSASKDRDTAVFLMAELTSPLSLAAGYVPLIRAYNFVVGLDKETLDAY